MFNHEERSVRPVMPTRNSANISRIRSRVEERESNRERPSSFPHSTYSNGSRDANRCSSTVDTGCARTELRSVGSKLMNIVAVISFIVLLGMFISSVALIIIVEGMLLDKVKNVREGKGHEYEEGRSKRHEAEEVPGPNHSDRGDADAGSA